MQEIFNQVFTFQIEQFFPIIGILLALCLVISSMGFFRLVLFISVGYGLSISGMAIASPIIFRGIPGLGLSLQVILLFLYGIRLSGYIILREFQSAYRREKKEVAERGSNVSVGGKLGIWIGVSLLYLTMFSPALFSFFQGQGANHPTVFIGSGIMLIGLSIETLADIQKSSFKKKHPKTFCNTGLYRFVRCPNYLGEILFWTGNVIAGVLSLTNFYFVLSALIGYVCIFLIMMGSTKRLEKKQEERYGKEEAFKKYATSVPVLFPFLPIYTLKHVKVYLE